MCNNDIGTRKGKVVCSTTCRVNKKKAFDYFDEVFRLVMKMSEMNEKECLDGIRKDEVKLGRPLRFFDAWAEKRGKTITTISRNRRKRF